MTERTGTQTHFYCHDHAAWTAGPGGHAKGHASASKATKQANPKAHNYVTFTENNGGAQDLA